MNKLFERWSEKFDYDVAVIGAGSGGLTATVGCRKFGLKTVLIDGGQFGGDCLNFGCVPSKTLIACAKVSQNARDADRFGINCSLPTTDWEAVKRRMASVKDTIRQHENPDYFRRMGMTVLEDYAAFHDSHTLDVGDSRLTARYIVIATGSRPKIPPIPHLVDVGFLTNESVFDIPEMPRRFAVIGAGPIGCELSQAFVRLGSEVTLFNNSSHVLGKEDDDMSDLIAGRLQDEGLEIEPDSDIIDTEQKANGEKIVRWKGNDLEKERTFDDILVATGRQSNIERLNLQAAGVKTVSNEMKIDRRMRTSQKHIYAIGDAGGGLLFTHMASRQASVAVRNIVFGWLAKNTTDAFPWVTYTDPELASVGYNEKRARAEGISYDLATASLSGNNRALTSGETVGKIKVLSHRDKIIGCQILAPHAGELIAEYTMAISQKMKLRDMAGSTHAYPTLSELNSTVAKDALAPKIFNNRVRKSLKILFGYRGKTEQ